MSTQSSTLTLIDQPNLVVSSFKKIPCFMKDNQTILVTGCTRGMGRTLVKWLALHDPRVKLVIAVGRDGPQLESLKTELTGSSKARVIACDVQNTSHVQKIADDLKAEGIVPDILVNNAAVMGPRGLVHEIPFDEFQSCLETNVLGVHNFMRSFIPLMKKRKGAVLINISSGWGRSPAPGFGAYCTSKWAVEGLTMTAAKEVGDDELCIVSLAPGIIQTDMLKAAGLENHGLPLEDWIKTFPDHIMGITKEDNGKQLTFKQ